MTPSNSGKAPLERGAAERSEAEGTNVRALSVSVGAKIRIRGIIIYQTKIFGLS